MIRELIFSLDRCRQIPKAVVLAGLPYLCNIQEASSLGDCVRIVFKGGRGQTFVL
jgi:hypothetical protein